MNHHDIFLGLLAFQSRVTVQVPPQLSGADELLDIPLDEDCLDRLLSNDLGEDGSQLKARLSDVNVVQACCLHAHLN